MASQIMIITVLNSEVVGETKAVVTAIRQILVIGVPATAVTANKVGLTSTASNQLTRGTAATVILVVSRAVMATSSRTKIITAVIRRLRGAAMVYRMAASTIVIRKGATKVVMEATICEIVVLTNSNRIINHAENKVANQIGISRPVFASRMIIGVKEVTVILRNGTSNTSRIGLATGITLSSRTGISRLTNRGNVDRPII